MFRDRSIVLILVLVGVLGLSGGAGAQQSDYQKKVEEWNAYQDIVRAQDLNQRMQAIESFLKAYPQSQYRPYVYFTYAETASAAQKHLETVEAVDGFLGMNRDQVIKTYRESNPNLDETAVNSIFYRLYVLNTLSFLQGFRENLPNAEAIAANAAERAQKGLEIHPVLYAKVQTPQGVTAEQFEQIKKQEEAAFHNVLAFVAFRKKDYATAAKEYVQLVGTDPNNPQLNYQLALSYLQQQPPQWEPGLWALGRSTVLNTKNQDALREALAKNMAAFQGVADVACAADQTQDLLDLAQQSPTPPADWKLPSSTEIAALREQLNVAKLIDGLKQGGEAAHVTWLAGCHLPFPEIPGVVVGIDNSSADGSVRLSLAITEESAKAETPDVELLVNGQPEVKGVKKGYGLRFTGVLTSYQQDPFLLKLSEGEINAEDLPKNESAPRRRSGGAGGGR